MDGQPSIRRLVGKITLRNCASSRRKSLVVLFFINSGTERYFSQDQLASILRQLQAEHGDEYGMALFMQEYYVSFDAALPGAIWGDCIAKLEEAGRIQTEGNPVVVPHIEGFLYLRDGI